jgi:pimeloyl-ACP methyl ester carboxylesterase
MQDTSIEVMGTQVRLLQAGAGPDLLYFHGIDGARPEPLLRELARSHRVIAPQVPGFGTSELPPWLMSIADAALFGLDLIQALGLQRVHLAGHSIGGWIAAEMAIRSTQHLASLVLLAPAGVLPATAPAEDVFLLGGERGLRAQFHDQAAAERELAARAGEELDIELQNRTGLARLAWTPRMASVQLPHWLHRIDVPTLLVWGTQDRVVPVACADIFRQRIPKVDYVPLPDCGHAIGFERGAEVAARMVQFMSGVA